MRPLAAAIAFLTRIPAGRIVKYGLADLSRSTPYFPVVGLLVGSVGGLVLWAGSLVWPSLLAVIVSICLTVLSTGAFHEDALADAFDGFGGGWTSEQVLAIMRDSRVGSYALIGVVLVVAAKIAALLAIMMNANDGGQAPRVSDACRALVAAHVLGRWSSVPLMRYHDYVRPASAAERPGAARPFVGSVTIGHLIAATLIAATIVAAAIGVRSISVWVVCIVGTVLAGTYFRRRIGGITGDALGATNQVIELLVYLVLAARIQP